jgi:cytidine deaminase
MTMTARRIERFEQALLDFPPLLHPLLQRLPEQGGKLPHTACQELMHQLDISLSVLMVRLLSLAQVFSVVPISRFPVGAVVLAENRTDDTTSDIYLGANVEFNQLALNMTLHAEQCAVTNAWHLDAGPLKAIATSETPCGHCRQFLQECYGSRDLAVLRPGSQDKTCDRQSLSEILPQAFRPSDLNMASTLMAPSGMTAKLKLLQGANDPMTQAALMAAKISHAPYSGNLAGCTLRTVDNQIVSGRSMESVAFNPSISALHAAIIQLNLMGLTEQPAIERVVLVEKPTRIRQKELVEMLARSWAPTAEFVYHIAQEEA